MEFITNTFTPFELMTMAWMTVYGYLSVALTPNTTTCHCTCGD